MRKTKAGYQNKKEWFRVAFCMMLSVCLLFSAMTVRTTYGEITQEEGLIEEGEPYLNRAKVNLVVGQSVQLKLEGAFKTKVKWKSAKPKTASVDKNGMVKALRKGVVVISAKYKNKLYKCEITIESPRINRKNVTLTIGEMAKVSVRGTKLPVVWSSNNSKIASVNQNGMITAHKIGTTKIRTRVRGKLLTCKVNVVTKQKAYEQELLRLMNYERSKYGVPALSFNKYLNKAAAVRAKELARYYSDTRPNRTSCFSAISLKYKWAEASELTARYYIAPSQVLTAWAEDQQRLPVVINRNYNDVGISVYVADNGKMYWCVLTARKQ